MRPRPNELEAEAQTHEVKAKTHEANAIQELQNRKICNGSLVKTKNRNRKICNGSLVKSKN